MYFWRTRLLSQDLKKNSINEANFKNYYLASSILGAVCLYLAMLQPHENMPALLIEALSTVVITVLGINAAFAANGGETGTRFIERAISLSFPLLIKVLVAGFFVGVLIGVLEIFGIGKYQLEWGNSIAVVVIQAVFYWRLVTHMRYANA